MRDADKASAASEEKISLSKSDLDEIKSYVSTYVAQYPVHESEKGYPDVEEDLPQSINEHTTDAKSYNVINAAGQSSRLGGNKGASKESLKKSEETLHNTDEDFSKVIILYIPPSRAACPTGITAAANIDPFDRQGNIDNQCYIRDNDIAAISQVPVCKTNLTYVRKNPSTRNRQPSKEFKFDFRKGKNKYHTAKFADLKPSLDFVVAQLVKKIGFITWRTQVIIGMMRRDDCFGHSCARFDLYFQCLKHFEHIDVVFYYLRKKAKLDTTSAYRYTTVNCVFMNYIHHTYTHYHRSHSEIDLSLHDEYVRSMKVASVERSICEIMQGLCIPVAIPWHFIDEVYVPINYKGSFHWVLAVVILKERCIRVYDSMKGHRGHAEEIN
ncbi:hypothetical protein CQW23_23846 [Capsicum baccatum]|uniref:Ubiquitin-like protease family profile domain-containing protein n=1 Tax=Capsicum baccatum TaxID=33114 RepID=A0A2G2VT57_CAPBA|nr:hypothetical protein CQW23_23846 [Capsicum baccatum]